MEFRQRHLTSHRNRGFTTFEVLIVIGVLGTIAAIGLSGYLRAQERASVSSQTERLASVVRQAQANAQTSVQGRAWGVRCTGSTWERFSINGGVTETDVQDTLHRSVRCVGTYDVRFSKLTGLASDDLTFALTDGTTTKRIVVTKAGTITVQ